MFLSSLLIFAGFNALAANSMSGEAACNRINNSSTRAQCLQVVYSSHRMDKYAVGACDRIDDGYKTLKCIETIANRSFEYAAIEACDRINDPQVTIQCLNAIGDKSFTRSEIQNCDSEVNAYRTVQCFEMSGRSSNDPRPRPPIPSPHPRPNPPTPSGDQCYVRQLGRNMDGAEFFEYASRTARHQRTCVVANLSFESYSHRIYNSYGERVAKSQGGMSNRDVERVLRNNNLYGCKNLTCERY